MLPYSKRGSTIGMLNFQFPKIVCDQNTHLKTKLYSLSQISLFKVVQRSGKKRKRQRHNTQFA